MSRAEMTLPCKRYIVRSPGQGLGRMSVQSAIPNQRKPTLTICHTPIHSLELVVDALTSESTDIFEHAQHFCSMLILICIIVSVY